MLALLVSFTVAVYLLGPDLLSRWIADLVVLRKTRIQSRGEEITRAVLVALIPLAIAFTWAYRMGTLARVATRADLETVFSALESDAASEEEKEVLKRLLERLSEGERGGALPR